ncbi:type II toxin-antitoxin system death-on-curing family toxin [Tychonema sp. LEGE 07203]|uniref:type II toxin-antitoxin system death-on-curing family toxin n=1 Tax=Tychonema sp. LEGE 07203 TaxID=1828671 RepID=UPI0018800DA3|nr:type II toxin-antitoxin system death-on-curing family toxin [Tychonema sp. LEGE 07203]MBE9092639.1 type II toxin-antitoxin system death-on-curing family toxin [Tychonema sp. LEGE 07203]
MQTPKFLSLEEVLELHDDQIYSFGGTPGVRDEGLLESALAQPQATFGGQLLHPTIAEQAAAYLYHIAMNHPFIDGNKRSAFAVADTFLRLNGCTLNLTDELAYDLIMRVARGTVTKEELSTEFESCIVKF